MQILPPFCHIDFAKLNKNTPSMIILNTIKGKGVSFVEKATTSNHSMPITKELLEVALNELKDGE